MFPLIFARSARRGECRRSFHARYRFSVELPPKESSALTSRPDRHGRQWRGQDDDGREKRTHTVVLRVREMNGAQSFIAEMRENANIVSPLASSCREFGVRRLSALWVFFGRRMLNRLRMLPKKNQSADKSPHSNGARSSGRQRTCRAAYAKTMVKPRNNTVNSRYPRRATRW